MIEPALAALLADPAVAAMLGLLNGAGEETRIVGGAVRNALIGHPVADIDLATTLLPEVVAARAAATGFRTVPTGIEHGTITVLAHGRPFEVTTLREDVETDGRRAVVRFGRDFAMDALRRDFTVNAMSLSPDGVLHDYAGGRADLAARRIRFIGDAHRRIREDYLRILRLFRFHAQYGAGPIDSEAYAAAIAGRDGFAQLSRERIRQELLKLLIAPGAAAAVEALAEAGLGDAILGGVDWRGRFARLVRQEPQADALLRLAVLAVAVREDVGRLRQRLRLSNAEQARLLALSGLAERFHDKPSPSEAEARGLLYRSGATAVVDAARYLGAAGDQVLAGAASLALRWPVPPPPFTGRDLMALGLPAGPALGLALARAEERWIAAGLPENATEKAAILRDIVSPQGWGAE